MALKMFTEEVTWVTNNVFIHKPAYDGCGYRVWFNVDSQYFRIGDVDIDTLEEASFVAKMFVTAILKWRASV